MAQVSRLYLAHLPPFISVYAALFIDVHNAVFLRSQLLAGNSEFEYAFIDASKVFSVSHLLAAVFSATNDMLQNRLKSRNVHSGIVFAMSPNNNIAESFRRFGMTDETSSLLAIKVLRESPESSVESTSHDLHSITAHLSASVDATPVTFSNEQLARLTDLQAIKTIYKLRNVAAPRPRGTRHAATASNTIYVNGHEEESLDNGDSGRARELVETEFAILAMMALKGS